MALFKKMFDQSVGGKGVLKEELNDRFTLLKFFRLLKRKFWRIGALNLLFVATNFPVIFFLIKLAGYGSVQRLTPYSPYWFGVARGITQFAKNPAASLFYSFCGVSVNSSYNSTLSYVFIALGLLVFITFGPANAGMAYILRNYTREEPCDIFSDYFRTIKKNFFQSLILGIIDLIFLVAMGFDLYLFFAGQGMGAFFAIVGTAAGIIYMFMRNYLYVMLITFDLSIPKIIKNALIFAFVNIKRNLAAFFGTLLCAVFTSVMLYFVTPIGALILLTLFFSFVSFIGIYCAYPAIKQYMIDPIIADERKKRKALEEEKEPIFTDRG